MKQDSSQGTYVDIKIKNRGFRFTVPRQYFGHVLVKMNNLKQFTYVLSSSVKCDYSTHRKLTAILWGSNKWPVTRLFRSLYFSHVHQHVAVSILAMLSKLHFSTITGSQFDYTSRPLLYRNIARSDKCCTQAWSFKNCMITYNVFAFLFRQWRSPGFRRLWSHQPEAAQVPEWLHEGEPLQTYILEMDFLNSKH